MRRLGGCITRPTALQMSTLYIFFKLFAPEHHLLECLYNHSNADVILCYYHQILFSCARFPLIPRQLRTSNSRISSVAKKILCTLSYTPWAIFLEHGYTSKSHTPQPVHAAIDGQQTHLIHSYVILMEVGRGEVPQQNCGI